MPPFSHEDEWYANICPLIEIGGGQFQRVKRPVLNLQGKEPTVFIPVMKLSPLKAFYVRSSNAYRVLYKGGNEENGEMVKRGVYSLEGFKFPQPVR